MSDPVTDTTSLSGDIFTVLVVNVILVLFILAIVALIYSIRKNSREICSYDLKQVHVIAE